MVFQFVDKILIGFDKIVFCLCLSLTITFSEWQDLFSNVTWTFLKRYFQADWKN